MSVRAAEQRSTTKRCRRSAAVTLKPPLMTDKVSPPTATPVSSLFSGTSGSFKSVNRNSTRHHHHVSLWGRNASVTTV